MTPRIYYKKAPKFNFDSIHFYEHLIVSQLLDALSHAGFIPGLWGHIDAESFEDIIMLQIGAYDDSVWPIIEKTLSSPLDLSTEALDNTLLQCESEAAATLSYDAKLIDELHSLNQLPFQNLDSLAQAEIIQPPNQNRPHFLQKTTQDSQPYHLQELEISFHSDSLQSASVFLRLAPIICDSVSFALTKQGIRTNASYGPELNNKGDFCCLIEFNCQSSENILATVQDYLQSIDFSTQAHAIAQYIEPFKASKEVASFFPVDYYRNCNILISRPLIAKNFTPAAVQSVWRQLKLKLRQQ